MFFTASEVPVGLTPAAVCSSGRALHRVSPGGWRPNCRPAWVSASLQSALFCYKICKYLSYDEYLPGRRNPLRMLSNAIDFRTRRKHRPKSADFENPEDGQSQSDTRSHCSAGTLPLREAERPGAGRSASVTDLLECVSSVSLSPGQQDIKGSAEVIKGAAKPRVLEGRNSAPDMLRPPGDSLGLQAVATLGTRGNRARARLSAGSETETVMLSSYLFFLAFSNIFFSSAASAKQKLSTRFQPQRKAQHQPQPRLVSASSSVKRAKTFSLGGPPGSGPVQTGFKTLPKQASSRSIGSTSTDSSQSSQSTASSRKSSNSSNISDVSMTSSGGPAVTEISQTALEEIAAFEKFITEYFENTDNNNTVIRQQKPSQSSVAGRIARQKVSASSILSEVLELSI